MCARVLLRRAPDSLSALSARAAVSEAKAWLQPRQNQSTRFCTTAVPTHCCCLRHKPEPSVRSFPCAKTEHPVNKIEKHAAHCYCANHARIADMPNDGKVDESEQRHGYIAHYRRNGKSEYVFVHKCSVAVVLADKRVRIRVVCQIPVEFSTWCVRTANGRCDLSTTCLSRLLCLQNSS